MNTVMFQATSLLLLLLESGHGDPGYPARTCRFIAHANLSLIHLDWSVLPESSRGNNPISNLLRQRHRVRIVWRIPKVKVRSVSHIRSKNQSWRMFQIIFRCALIILSEDEAFHFGFSLYKEISIFLLVITMY